MVDRAIPRPGRRLLELLSHQLAQVCRQLLRRGLLAHLRQDLFELLIGDQHLEQTARVPLEHLLLGQHLGNTVLGELGLEVVDKLARRHRVQFDPLVAQEGDLLVGNAADVTRLLDVVANFLVVRTMQDGEMTIFGAGRYVDRVKPDAGGWKFASKTVVLDSRQIDTLLAIPI